MWDYGRDPTGTEGVIGRLRAIVSHDLWQQHFERCCGEGAEEVHGEVGRYREVLAASGFSAKENDVRLTLRLLAVELYPSSPAARQIREGTVRVSPSPPVEQTPVGHSSHLIPASGIMAAAMAEILRRSAKFSEGSLKELKTLLSTVGPRASWGGREYVIAALAASSRVREDLLKLSEASDNEVLLELTRNIHEEALKMGCTIPPEHFSDHVHRVRHEVFRLSPDSRDGEWLSALDEQVTEYMKRDGLYEVLSPDEHAAHVERALALTLSGDRAGARNEYRRLYRAAKTARNTRN